MSSAISSLTQRVKSLLLSPRQTLQTLADAPTSAREAMTGHLMLLALIPAVAQFVGSSLIGLTVLGTTYRTPFLKGLTGMLLTYIMVLIGAAILAFILKSLASRYDGEPSLDRAMPLVAYASTAAMVGSIFTALPWLGLLSTITGIYSLYMLYIAIPMFMRSNSARTLGYFLIAIVLAFLCNMLLSWLLQTANPYGQTDTHGREQAEAQWKSNRQADDDLPPELAKSLEWLQNMQKHLPENNKP